MREVALADRDPELAALLDDVARSGEAVLLTRNGKPVATLSPTANIGARLLAHMDDRARRHPASAAPLPWETLRAELDEDRL